MLTLCYELLFMISHNSFFNGEAQWNSAIALGIKAKRQGRRDGCKYMASIAEPKKSGFDQLQEATSYALE